MSHQPFDINAAFDASRSSWAVLFQGELQQQTSESHSIMKSMMKRTFDTLQAETSDPAGRLAVDDREALTKHIGIDLG